VGEIEREGEGERQAGEAKREGVVGGVMGWGEKGWEISGEKRIG
jgi:hypothetical protein